MMDFLLFTSLSMVWLLLLKSLFVRGQWQVLFLNFSTHRITVVIKLMFHMRTFFSPIRGRFDSKWKNEDKNKNEN